MADTKEVFDPSKTYVVTAACAQVYNVGRTGAVTVARNGLVPSGVDPEHAQHLLDMRLIEAREFSGGLDVNPEQPPPFPPPEGEMLPGEEQPRSSARKSRES